MTRLENIEKELYEVDKTIEHITAAILTWKKCENGNVRIPETKHKLDATLTSLKTYRNYLLEEIDELESMY